MTTQINCGADPSIIILEDQDQFIVLMTEFLRLSSVRISEAIIELIFCLFVKFIIVYDVYADGKASILIVDVILAWLNSLNSIEVIAEQGYHFGGYAILILGIHDIIFGDGNTLSLKKNLVSTNSFCKEII